MKLNLPLVFVVCLTVLILVTGCINPPDGSLAVAADRVHIVGEYGSYNKAFYWNDGILTLLDAPDGDIHVSASSVSVSGGVVYVGGQCDGRPCYWINGVRHDIVCESGSIAGIAVDSTGRLIMAGTCDGEGSVWIDDLRSALQVPSGSAATVNSLTVIGDVIYAAGSCTSIDDWSDLGSHYWTDGVSNSLPVPSSVMPGGSARTSGIAVLGSSVIVSGTYDSDAEDAGAGYWRDGVWNALDGSTARGVTVGGNMFCIVGRDSDGACYWLDGQKTSLLAVHSTIATAVAFSGNTFVAAGERGAISQDDTVGYWSGGDFIDIHEDSIADINGIFITD
ncbi:MAG: hypothetical protein JEZ04_20945 [Spirochaetales bacterium]|nr:hypothetical protein [Spirochaetales bacterium]